MIKLENIQKVFRTEEVETVALGGVSLEVKKGEFVAIMGPSGCGKSTLLNILGLLDNPTSGTYYLDGNEVGKLKESQRTSVRKGQIGFVFQSFNLIDELNVEENVELPLTYLGVPKKERKQRVEEVLRRMAISHRAHHFPQQLSGGQQQRVAIARTLAPEPKVLFMDEPLSNLDAKLRLEMRTELKRLHAETDSTFVYVTHDQLEAMTLATRICLMKDGVLQQYDPPLEVYNNPANLFVADFVGNPTMNFLPGTARILDETHAEVTVLGRSFLFESDAPLGKPEGEDVVLGVRPEFIRLGSGGMEGKVYAALPAGMETTVQMTMGDQLVTSVEFGSVDYKANSPMRFDFHGKGLILFDKKSGKKLGRGSATQR